MSTPLGETVAHNPPAVVDRPHAPAFHPATGDAHPLIPTSLEFVRHSLNRDVARISQILHRIFILPENTS